VISKTLTFINMKKITKIFILLAILGLSISSVFAQGGTTGPLTWELNGNTLTISGNGAMPDYSAYNDEYAPWSPYQLSIYTVVVQTGVTTIGSEAFYPCINLTSVTIPNSVISIGDWAFSSSNLVSVTIPNSVISIGDWAFYGCSSLTSVTIGTGLTTIGELVFTDCISLTAIDVNSGNTAFASETGVLFNKEKTILIQYPAGKTNTTYIIPNGVTTIGNRAFSHHYNYLGTSTLASVMIPNSVTSIGEAAFYNCSSLAFITIPEGVTSIEYATFLNCLELTTVTLPNSITSIGELAFGSCGSLASLTIPNNVTTIESEAFKYCNGLTSVTIPNSVTNIGYSAFESCGVETVNFNAINCTSMGSSVFSNCSAFTTLNIGSDVQNIPNNAFSGCNKLTSITTYAQNPPTLGTNPFHYLYNIPVYIPCLSYNSYKNAPVWKDYFTNFIVPGVNPFSYTTKCYFPYSDDIFTNLTEAGVYKTYGVLPGDNCESYVTLTLLEKPLPQLCMITVDETYHNEIVWKKQDGILSYNIYREGAQSGQYDLVATIEPESPNKWVDMESNAKIRSYRYKVSSVDTCGKESVQSNAHKTMHLTINAGQNNSWNLIWTAYEGTAYSTYNIYRTFGDTPGEFQLIGTMPSGNTSFSDFGAPAGYVYYIVEIVLNETCNVGKAGSSIKSNIASNNPNIGIDDFRLTIDDLRIYPNPTTGQLIIDNGQLTIDNVEVFDVYGRNVLSHTANHTPQTRINISHLSTGVYFVKIRTEAGEVVRKVVKE